MTEEQFWHCYNQLRVPADDFLRDRAHKVLASGALVHIHVLDGD